MPKSIVIDETLKLSQEDINWILLMIKKISNSCDGARDLDGVGFNKNDSALGHSLAKCYRLTFKQALLALHLVYRYRKQLSEDENKKLVSILLHKDVNEVSYSIIPSYEYNRFKRENRLILISIINNKTSKSVLDFTPEQYESNPSIIDGLFLASFEKSEIEFLIKNKIQTLLSVG